MGHSWREMDPAGARRHDEYLDRLIRTRKALKDVRISEFTVGELGSLFRCMGFLYNTAGSLDPSEADFTVLERKLESIAQNAVLERKLDTIAQNNKQ